MSAISTWTIEDSKFWQATGKRIANRNLWISIPALLLAFAVWMVWSVVVAKLPAVGFKFTTDQLFWLAAIPGLSGATLRIFYSFMPPIFGGRIWTTLSTASLLLPAIGIGFAVQNPSTPYILFVVAGAAVRLRRRQLRLLDGQYQLLLPEGGEGQCARAQCRSRQSRRQRGAVRHPAGDHGRRVRLARRRSADRDRGRQDQPALAAERRLHLGAVHRHLHHRGLVRHERHRGDEGLVRRSGGDLQAQAQLADVLALYRNLRFLHRLFGGLPAAGQDPVPAGRIRSSSSSSGRWSARCRARPPAGCPTNTAAAASPSGCSR